MEEAAAMAALLPDDVLLEILFRLKEVPAALFRCATACKLWCGLVAEPAFLRRCWPDQDVSSFFIGFFTGRYTGAGGVLPPYCFSPTPRSVLNPRQSALMSFMIATHADAAAVTRPHVFHRAVPLVSRHGLLLVRLNTNTTRGYPDLFVLELGVCNLLTGACHTIPTLKFSSVFDECQWSGYAILSGADGRSNDEAQVLPSNSSFFKVVIVRFYNKGDMDCSLHTISSDEESWSTRTKCFGVTVQMQPNKYWSCNNGVVRRGIAHWLFLDWGKQSLGFLTINMRTGDISLVKLPSQINSRPNYQLCLTLTFSGALSLLCMQQTGNKLEIWEQQEEQSNKDDGSKWVCTRKVDLKELGKSDNEGRELRVLGEKNGTLLVIDTIRVVYTADLQTGVMEEVVDMPRMGFIMAWETIPLEVDWPGFISSRLDTRAGTNVSSRKQKTETK